MSGPVRRSLLLGAVVIAAAATAFAGTTPTEGLRENKPAVHALINARIVHEPGRVTESGIVVIRDGVIVAAGKGVSVPADARVWDCEGRTVSAGFIETYSHLGISDKKDDGKEAEAGAPYWNPNVTPERSALDRFEPSENDLEAFRQLGFTTALVVPRDGIIGGTIALVALGDERANDRIIKERAAQAMALTNVRWSLRNRVYPTSMMGKMALLRQAFLDARWYKDARAAYASNPAQPMPETNDALAALENGPLAKMPVLCAVDTEDNLLRALRIAGEFDLNMWIRGSGHEYRVTSDLASAKGVILPLNFPEAPDVSTPEKALGVSLLELQHWETAPSNARMLADAGVGFAFTTDGLEKKKDFAKQLRKAIDRGLSTDVALAALTTVPAKMLGLSDRLGRVEKGMQADLVVWDGDLFDKKTKVVDVWIEGDRYAIDREPDADPRGEWNATIEVDGFRDADVVVAMDGEIEKLKGSITRDSTKTKLGAVTIDHHRIAMRFDGDDFGVEGVVRMSGGVSGGEIHGQGMLPDGATFAWSAKRASDEDTDGGNKKDDESGDDSKDGDADASTIALLPPGGAFAYAQRPDQPRYVFVRNATVWTSGPQGTIEGADMVIKQGVIVAVGRDLKVPKDAVVIDGTGKHVTPGLIDCHSHTGMTGGANEVGRAVTAEVRVADIVDPDNIAFYRELAGGLTAANILHGSANPIGGQNAVVKLRWGGTREEMLIDDAIPGIKFALGENVKQSNWGEDFTTRYPQTRMGVEQFIRDRFKAAQDYEKDMAAAKKNHVPPRRNLELDALVEVLHGKRLVHCHSYRQDEILMLIRVAEDFGFTIGTFQHVLEGYKVADAIAAHGAGASTFSDWWAYKFEVYDAIPYNGALMYRAGVIVSFNSDSAELARRMNLEAAKAVKYGGVEEAEALKFVTLNPAKQLRIDHRTGSLEKGKDADFVVWSGNPLSTYSKCEQTWIDGRKYFDIDQDAQARVTIAAERARLIQRVLNEGGDKKKRGKKAATPAVATANPEEEYSCAGH